MSSSNTPIELREAKLEDARFVWRVNNDPTVRARSVHSKPIPLNQHLQWFSEAINSPSRFLYIVVVDGIDSGVVRFDVAWKERTALMSIALAPEARGRRIGTEVIRIASRRMMGKREIDHLLAEIRLDNTASLKAFERAGYQPTSRNERNGILLEVLSLCSNRDES